MSHALRSGAICVVWLGVVGIVSVAEAGRIQVELNGTVQADGFNNIATPTNLGTVIIGAPSLANTTSYRLINQSPPVAGNPRSASLTAAGHASVSPTSVSLANGVFSPFLSLGLSTTAVGARSGSVTIATTSSGPADLTDVIHLAGTVLDHSNASFNGTLDQNSLVFDFGTLGVGGPTQSQTLSLTNLVTTSGFTAGLDLDSISGTGDTGVLTTNLALFSNLAAGSSSFFDIFFDRSTIGSFSAVYTLSLSDQDLPGATVQLLTLTLLGDVVPEPSSMALLGMGLVCAGAYRLRRRKRLDRPTAM